MKVLILVMSALSIMSCATSEKIVTREPQQAGTGSIGSNRFNTNKQEGLPIFANDLRMIKFNEAYTQPLAIQEILNFDFGSALKDPNCLKKYVSSTKSLYRISGGAKIIMVVLSPVIHQRSIVAGFGGSLIYPVKDQHMEFTIGYDQMGGDQTWNDSIHCALN